MPLIAARRRQAGVPPADPPAAGEGFGLVHALLFVTGLGFFMLASSFSQLSVAYPLAGWMTAICGVIGLALVVAALVRAVLPARYHAYVFALAVALVAVLSYIFASAEPALPSDEVGLTAAAAQAIVHGHDPYTIDYVASDPEIAQHDSSWYTHTFSGAVVSHYDYPAAGALILAPLAAAVDSRGLTLVYPMLLLLSVVLAWVLVPPRVRPFVTAILLLMTSTSAVTAYIDPLYLPFLIIAVWRWPRFVDPGAGLASRLAAPVALGIACSIKQNAWLVAPFLLLGIALECRARGGDWRRAAAAYTGTAVATFVVINAPFMIADWRAWWTAVSLPFTLHTVLFGIGVAAVPLAVGGDQLQLLSISSVLALLATLLVAAAMYRRVRLVLPLLPLVAVMVSTRSLSGYIFFLFIPAVVAATTVGPLPDGAHLAMEWTRRLRTAGAAFAIGAVALVAFTLAQRAPLTVAVTDSQVSGARWQSVSVRVGNQSSRTISPAFFAAPSAVLSYALTRTSGPAELPPGASATYELRPLPGDQALQVGGLVRIVALSDQPQSISESDLYRIGGGAVGG